MDSIVEYAPFQDTAGLAYHYRGSCHGWLRIVFFAMSYFAMYERAESELLGAAESLAEKLQSGIPSEDLQIPDIYFHRFGKATRDRAYWRIWDADRKLAAQGGEFHESYSELAPATLNIPNAGPKQFSSRKIGKRLELFLTSSRDDLIMIGRPLSKEFDSLWRIGFRLLGICGLGFLIATSIGWWISRRIADPIATFTEQVRTIDSTRLQSCIVGSQPTMEMTQLATAFNDMMRTLQESFDRQKQFTSDAAHELRTPVSIVLAQSEFCLHRDRSEKVYLEGFETCYRAAWHMKGILTQLLELSCLDAGKLEVEFKPLEFARVIQETVRLMEPIANAKDIRLEAHTVNVLISADETRIKQILFNLLANALEYSPGQSIVSVEMELLKNHVRLKIVDRGIGIPVDALPKVWNRFYRVDRARTQNGNSGTGLGLSLVKDLVQLHGGTCSIESVVGEGTTVQVCFPRIVAD